MEIAPNGVFSVVPPVGGGASLFGRDLPHPAHSLTLPHVPNIPLPP